MHGLNIAYDHNLCEWHYSCCIINFTEETNSTVSTLYVSFLLTMPPKPSYKQNQNYSKQIDWTYDLKRDAYNCYLRAKENPNTGYTKRLKNYWN